MEAVSPNKSLNDVQDKDPSERKECPVNGNGEHRDVTDPVLQIYPTRFYSNCTQA